MTTIKSYTDLEQSRKLAEILPIESADMNYWCGTQIRIGGHRTMDKDLDIPCWSLVALLKVLPFPSLYETFTGYRCDSYNKDGITFKLGESADNPIDACYNTIIKLHELNIMYNETN